MIVLSIVFFISNLEKTKKVLLVSFEDFVLQLNEASHENEVHLHCVM